MPGRSLTLADFPSSSASDSIESSPGEPYQRRFIPVPASLADLTLGPCSPIGIWPSAMARKRTSPEWHSALLNSTNSEYPVHGYQALRSTGGPFSVLTAVLATINHGLDTVLTFWKRAELYLTQTWAVPDCFLPEDVTSTTPTASPLFRVSLSRILPVSWRFFSVCALTPFTLYCIKFWPGHTLVPYRSSIPFLP